MDYFETLQFILFIGSALFVSFCIALVMIQRVVNDPYPTIKRHKEEKYFLDTDKVENIEFPSIEDEPSLDLSVVVPAYNEETRLPKMLDECLEFLEAKARTSSFRYEVIVVSDGSSDGTVSCALKYGQRFGSNRVRVLELIDNRGKGGAVRLGMLSTRGRFLLFADADGATTFADYDKVSRVMAKICPDWKNDAIVIGSRAHLEQEAIASRNKFRTFLMYGFHFLVWLFAVKKIRDTQCGFKLLSRSSAKTIFASLHVEGWAFDVELLHIAQRLKIPIEEVAVNWTEIEGSKLTPFWSWLQMGADLCLIWFRYTIGAWKIQEKPHIR